MNPFLYKPHPLLARLMELLAHPGAHGLNEFSDLALVFLLANLPAAAGFSWMARRAAGVRLPFPRSYLLGLPATLVYLPLMVTVVADVAAQSFRWEDRLLTVFTLFVGSQMLGGGYALAVRGRRGEPVGLSAGLTIALFLLLLAIPAAGLLLALDRWVGVF